MEQFVFPRPRVLRPGEGFLRLSGRVLADSPAAEALAGVGAAAVGAASELLGLTPASGASGSGDLVLSLPDAPAQPEAYEIAVDGQTASLRAGDYAGFVHGIQTLRQLMAASGERRLPCLEIQDAPFKAVRGVHLYLPPPDAIDEFCRILDALSYLKYNTIFLELGGGVYYESHPEIPKAWMRFCREARNHPKGPQGLQASEAYWKDSTHVENAGGFALTKAQLLGIVERANFLGLEVIPEIQGLSHCYYLTLAHREIAERPFETWPDSYCPRNEDSYRLYFDLAAELHALLGFRKVSIGHDEVRILGECPRCRDYSGHELLAYEVNRLHEFYRGLGVEVWMWGEKLQDFTDYRGKRAGGQRMEKTDRYGRGWVQPATYEAVEHVPRDIVMLDWYHMLGAHTEDEFQRQGFREIFGNFYGSKIDQWERRGAALNVLGAEVSTWCVSDENEIGRNGWFPELTFSAALLWREDYTSAQYLPLLYETARRQAALRAVIAGRAPVTHPLPNAVLRPENPTGAFPLAAEATPDWARPLAETLGENGRLPYALSAGTTRVDTRASSLLFFHGADGAHMPFDHTWFFKDRKPYNCARYAVDYADGVTVAIPVELGVQTGNFSADWGRSRPTDSQRSVEEEGDAAKAQAQSSEPPLFNANDAFLHPAMYFSDAYPLHTGEKLATVYAWRWENPRPEVKILSLRLIDDQAGIPLYWFGTALF